MRSALLFASEPSPNIADDPYFNGDKAQAAVLAAVRKLPAKQQTVFIMRWYEDMDYEEISAVTGTSVGALKASYHIAAEKLKKELKEQF